MCRRCEVCLILLFTRPTLSPLSLHVPAKIKGHKRANNDGDGSVMEEVKKGDLTKAAPQDEEIGVEVLEILLKGGRGGMEGGRQETGDRRQETGDKGDMN